MYLSRPQSFAERVRETCAERGTATAFSWLDSEGVPQASLSFAELDRRATLIAARIRAQQPKGAMVLLLCPPGLDYVASLLGGLYAGAVVLPAVLPTTSRISERVRSIVRDSGVTCALLPREQHASLTSREGLSELRCIDSAAGDDQVGQAPDLVFPVDAPTILQYTSGSTSAPKGVVVTQSNLLANQQMMQRMCGIGFSDTCISWLPPHHDMGLMGSLLQSMFAGSCTHLMAPDLFARRPERWLLAATRHRATVLPGPDFAYRLCAQIDDAVVDRLQLDTVRIAFTAAEPIRAATLDAFVTKFARRGFKRSAFYPCYGMAESTLFITGSAVTEEPVLVKASAAALRDGRVQAPEPGEAIDQFVCSGRTDEGAELRVVDPHGQVELPDGHVGEIWLRGASVTRGYFNKPAETAEFFAARLPNDEGPFLRTGDMGFVMNGGLYLTGRLKEMLIVNGLNHYPQDIEQTVQSVSERLVAGAGAAFAVPLLQGGEGLVVVQEALPAASMEDSDAEVLSRIVARVSQQHGLRPAAICLVRRGNVPKTPSGKLQRLACRASWESGQLRVLSERRWPELGLTQAAPPPQESAIPDVAPAGPHTLASVAAFLRSLLAPRLGIEASDIRDDISLSQYGLDSLQAAELTERLEDFLGRSLPQTLTYDNPSIRDIARAVLEGSPRGPAGRETPPPRPVRNRKEGVAIVGMACRLPGAQSPESFFDNLTSGRDALTEIPQSRFDLDEIYDPRPGRPGRTNSRRGGFLKDVDQFDAAFFHISAREAAAMDPQQRLFLECVWTALEDAGIDPTSLADTETGVFAAAASHDYALLTGRELHGIGADYGTGNAASVIANRVSYFFNWTGPSQTVDAACASGLVALHEAVRAIEDGDCEVAVVGAVNAILSPQTSVFLSQARALSPSGRCQPFAKEADGFVRSEGVAVLVLRSVSSARQAHNRLRAVIAGSAVNHSGQSNGIMAPSAKAQEQVLLKALRRANMTAADVDVIEAHGVGTRISDMVEWEALRRIMTEAPRSSPCWVGSVKSHIGHTEAVSGLAGTIKMVMALERGVLPETLGLTEPSPDLSPAQDALKLLDRPQPWLARSERSRVAGISAFGLGGTNAHLIVTEPPPTNPEAQNPAPYLFVLSAQGPEALARAQEQLSNAVTDRDLARISATLLRGRAQMRSRFAAVAATTTELQAALRARTGTVADPARLASSPVSIACAGRPLSLERAQAVIEALAALEPAQPTARLQRETQEVRSCENGAEVALGVYAECRLATFFGQACAGPVEWVGTGAGVFAALAAAGCLSSTAAAQAGALYCQTQAALTAASPEAAVVLRRYRKCLQALQLSPAEGSVRETGGALTLGPGDLPTVETLTRLVYLVSEPASGFTEDRAACVTVSVTGCLAECGSRAEALRATVLEKLGQLFASGVRLLSAAVALPESTPTCSLPHYPFERRRYWYTDEPAAPRTSAVHRPVSPAAGSAGHPILSRARIITPYPHDFAVSAPRTSDAQREDRSVLTRPATPQGDA